MTSVGFKSDLEWAMSIVPMDAELISFDKVRIKIRKRDGKYKFKNKLQVIFKRGGKFFKTYIGR